MSQEELVRNQLETEIRNLGYGLTIRTVHAEAHDEDFFVATAKRSHYQHGGIGTTKVRALATVWNQPS